VLSGPGEGGTLDPERQHATSLDVVIEVATKAHPHLRDEAAEGLADIVDAQLRSFPDNLFWDLDLLAVRLVAQASESTVPARALRTLAGDVAALQELYGQRTPIRFRYVHDFLYGFDWARWVARRPPERASVGPFDLGFFDYGRQRGAELLELIDRNDAKYPRLGEEVVGRNPFRFSREPADERRLLRDLSSRGLVPVEAWRADGRARWETPFSDLREARAKELGLQR
jgi:hypothetical protein